jgi:crotonobetainyl-CoA:carnitine CoA-transferase CaiB-like acyl-CoA transferase
VGGDTRSVLAEAGYSEVEIQEMEDSGVVAAG